MRDQTLSMPVRIGASTFNPARAELVLAAVLLVWRAGVRREIGLP